MAQASNLETEKEPVKLFVKDIEEVTFDTDNKYIVHLYGMKFKNVRLHGVVTDILSLEDGVINIEVSDVTGRVCVFHNRHKCRKISKEKWRHVKHDKMYDNEHTGTMKWMIEQIEKGLDLNFQVGDFVSILGDIYVDDLTNAKCISAFELKKSSITADMFWMYDLYHIYEHYYKKNS